MPTKTLGEFIREKRNQQEDMSLRELARKLEITPSFLSDIELGRRFPSEAVLGKLANFLKVSVEELKQYDARESLGDFKRMMETSPELRFAFRKAVNEVKDGKTSVEKLIGQFSGKKGKP